MIMLGVAAVALFALSVLLHAYGAPSSNSKGRVGPGAYSTSAIGYAGLYDLLKRLDRNVSRSAGDTLEGLRHNGVLVIAEPDLSILTGREVQKLFQPPNLLLVLPKWDGERDPERPAWIGKADLLPLSPVRGTIQLIDRTAKVHREPWPEKWQVNFLGTNPAGTGMVQLVSSDELEPLVGTADAMLVGEMWTDDDVRVIVLADPDVLANHGIGRERNADFAINLFDRLTYDDSAVPVVFDETVHGFNARNRSPLRLLFEFPYVVATILACCAGGIIVLAGMGRFGPPSKQRTGLDFGKSGLIDNSARLMHHAGHHVEVLRRYVRMTFRSTALSLHAPQELDVMGQAEWLDRLGKAKKVEISCVDVMRRALSHGEGDAAFSGLMRCAEEIHRWHDMMLARPILHEKGDGRRGE
jgi:hypothetical protein